MAPKSVPGSDSELLELIVLIELRDRMKAMEIRYTSGTPAAIAFVRGCCDTCNEDYDDDREIAAIDIEPILERFRTRRAGGAA